MAIAFRSLTSTSYGTRTNTVLTAPAGLADGDILFLSHVLARASGVLLPGFAAPAGFTQIGTETDVSDGVGFNAQLRVYWKRAASESGSYTVTHQNQVSQGVLSAYSGCLAAGTPVSAASSNTGTGSSQVGTGITTTAANSFLLFIGHNWVASGALSPPTGMTERFDNFTYWSDQSIASAGATGTRTQSNGNGSGEPWATRMVELLQAVAVGTTVTVVPGAARAVGKIATVTASNHQAVMVVPGTLRLVGSAVTVTATGEVAPEAPAQLSGPGPGAPDRRRFEIFLLEDEDEQWQQKSRRKRRLRLPKAEIEDKVEAAVEHIAAGSPQPMSQNATVAQVSTLMGLDALLEIDRRRVERTIYRYLAALLEEQEEEEMAMLLLAA